MNEDQIKQDSIKAWILAARPKTLTGAAVPVMIGLALAWVDTRDYISDVFSWTAAILCLAFALIMQINANFINDFFDYTRGNDDAETRLGPLRACTQGWVKIDSMKRAIALTTCIACLVGLPLILYGGMEIYRISVWAIHWYSSSLALYPSASPIIYSYTPVRGRYLSPPSLVVL